MRVGSGGVKAGSGGRLNLFQGVGCCAGAKALRRKHDMTPARAACTQVARERAFRMIEDDSEVLALCSLLFRSFAGMLGRCRAGWMQFASR